MSAPACGLWRVWLDSRSPRHQQTLQTRSCTTNMRLPVRFNHPCSHKNHLMRWKHLILIPIRTSDIIFSADMVSCDVTDHDLCRHDDRLIVNLVPYFVGLLKVSISLLLYQRLLCSSDLHWPPGRAAGRPLCLEQMMWFFSLLHLTFGPINHLPAENEQSLKQISNNHRTNLLPRNTLD